MQLKDVNDMVITMMLKVILKVDINQSISFLKKHSAGCLKAMYSDVDNFSVMFPKEATK
jgi:hypothetical protein